MMHADVSYHLLGCSFPPRFHRASFWKCYIKTIKERYRCLMQRSQNFDGRITAKAQKLGDEVPDGKWAWLQSI